MLSGYFQADAEKGGWILHRLFRLHETGSCMCVWIQTWHNYTGFFNNDVK